MPQFELHWPERPAGVDAAFTLRSDGMGRGGASSGPYASFNLATHVGDDPSAVVANRQRLRQALSLPAEPAWLQQIHGRSVLDLDRPSGADIEASFEADAVVTARPGLVCAVQVADCLPVLFATRDGSRIGAAHAGWRGLAAGVLEATMASLGAAPDRINAWIGPAICREHFEVGNEVREVFVDAMTDAARCFTQNERGRWQCDLPLLAADRLRAAGVGSVATAGDCTFADRDRFYSYRRDGRCGRMAALIWRSDGGSDSRGRGLKGGDTP